MEKIKIVLKNVTKEIKGHKVLDNVNLIMENGYIYGIKGYNGSGKTMLMRTLAGLIYPTEGEIYFNETKMTASANYNGKVGALIENPAFLDSYSGFENLKLLASIEDKISKEEIYKVLNTVGLDATDKRKYKKYSLGMKQRLGIAAAIMERPDIILLDEPINALDSEGIILTKEIIKEEKERGALIVLSCHDEKFLREVSDELYLIECGKITKEEKEMEEA